MTPLTERQAAICLLMAQPFEDGYVRGCKPTLEGKPDRHVLLALQPAVYTAWKRHERDGERLCD